MCGAGDGHGAVEGDVGFDGCGDCATEDFEEFCEPAAFAGSGGFERVGGGLLLEGSWGVLVGAVNAVVVAVSAIGAIGDEVVGFLAGDGPGRFDV